MEWKSGMKLRCIKDYNDGIPRRVGDVVTLKYMNHFDKWSYEESYGGYIVPRNKKYWEVVKMEFTKNDLQIGMLVETRNGINYLLMEKVSGGMEFVRTEGRELFYLYRQDLTNMNDEDWDIVKVYSLPTSFDVHGTNIYGTENRKLVWERKEKLEVSMKEIADVYGVDVEQLRIKDYPKQ